MIRRVSSNRRIILRKCKPKAFVEGVAGLVVVPVLIKGRTFSLISNE